ncbi:MAG TPA: laminin G domain-containing protein [Candidatus Paceibacterota bacterium]|nr:laminin G domain-containing protein [Candidatus Paceibacterota bacterium]HRZ93342.1 laminin G domain-containing protein [Candidatus Paceibacterota bacterium]
MSSLTQSDRSSFCQKMNSSRWLLLALPLAAAPHLGAAGPEPALWSWQQTHAQVDPKGDLTWTPRPFVFEKGTSVRYIDFEAGDDAGAGDTPATPWKHHPWDPNATGKAAAESGVRTYIFKRGVVYRGRLLVQDAGRPGEPIRLTSDPAWGSGEAILCGSERVTNWVKGADRKDIPDPDKVWRADLPFAPRAIWSVDADGRIVRIPLARTPNWRVSNPDDVKREWWVWDNPRKPFGNTITNASGQAIHLGIDTLHIKDKPADYFLGALIWPEFGWVMSAPYPTEVEVVDLERHGLGFAGWTGGGTGGVIMRNMRYYLEDKPHYLDDDLGEYWFDKKGAGGRLYLRPPAGTDPNRAGIEAARWSNLVDGQKVEHLHIAGLAFRFTTPAWSITAAPWDFRTRPWGLRPEMHPGCVRVWGEGRDIRIAHCRFEHVYFPIRIRSIAVGQRVDDVWIEDNDFRFTDDGILSVADGSAWGYADLRGRLGDVRICRNHSIETGRRPARYGSGTGIEVAGARTVEIAGNVIERSYAQGIDVHGAKPNGAWGDVPFARILIHHNKVWESMLNCNDFGGIETWQGGPAYVFDNLSYNALGYRNWNRYTGADAGFGHAYYLDGAFKNYHFNNIAWGKSKDTASPTVNCSAFQEIISYQNTFFHNTVFNYHAGSRRQSPEAGRNKYLANVWHSIGQHVFRHADPARTAAEANAADTAALQPRFALESNAYARNVFHDFKEMGVLEPSGRWRVTFDDFQSVLRESGSLASDLGIVSPTSPLRDPARGDFRPTRGSAAMGHGAKVFVPWALSGVVGEWHFYPSSDDPARVMDEHWYMTDYHVSRDTYFTRPTYPLRAANIGAADYVEGPLEDWIPGALRFTAARGQYAFLAHAEMMKPFSFQDLKKSRHEGARPEPHTVEGEALKNPQIHTSSFLAEIFFRTAPGHTGGLLVEKMDGIGYRLAISHDGRLAFRVSGPDASASVESQRSVNDGQWHHAIAEADRRSVTLTIYLDGRKDAAGPGVDGSVSLANAGDLHVGGTPGGHGLDGAIDFLRLAQGTLADADTTIEELYAWEFDGPFLRDFGGRTPAGGRRAAGAIGQPD